MSFKIIMEKPVVGQIRHELSDVLDYWQTVRRDQILPRWHFSSFDIAALNPKILPNVAVFDVLESDFRIRYFGTQRVRLQGKDYTNCLLSEYRPEMIAVKINEELSMVLEAREPMHVTTKKQDSLLNRVVTYEFIYLPLGHNMKDVDTVFTLGLDDRSLRELHQEYDKARREGFISPSF